MKRRRHACHPPPRGGDPQRRRRRRRWVAGRARGPQREVPAALRASSSACLGAWPAMQHWRGLDLQSGRCWARRRCVLLRRRSSSWTCLTLQI